MRSPRRNPALDITQLEVFLAVAQERSFSRAGQRLARTQAAISQSIRKLEEELGEKLFDRSVKDGTLTDSGRVLLEYAHKILNLREEAQGALRELRSLHQGKLRIGANEHTVMYLLPVLATYRAEYPQIKVEVHRCQASTIGNELLRHTIDIGVQTFLPKQPELEAEMFARDSAVLVVAPSHQLAGHDQVSVTELGLESFVAHNVSSPQRQTVIETFQKHQTPLNINLELPSIEALKRFIEMRHGIGILPSICVQTEVRQGVLVAIPIREMKIERKIHLVYRRTTELSHAAQAFLRTARGHGKVGG